MTKQTYVMTTEEAVQLNTRMDQYKINLVGFKGDTHALAYDSLRHFHNTGNPSMIQKFYDILAEDKLLRKSGYAKWVLEYAPLVFNEEKKTFSRNKNPNAGKALYMENAEQASPLLASAYGKKFWEMDGGNEQVNKSTPDRITEKLESWLKIMVKETEKGDIPAEFTEVYARITPAFKGILEIVAPVTTKELEKNLHSVVTETQDVAA